MMAMKRKKFKWPRKKRASTKGKDRGNDG